MNTRIENGKVINEKDEVAVLYSPNYGAGWYSWNADCEDCLFIPEIVELILSLPEDEINSWRYQHSKKIINKIEAVVYERYDGTFYSGGARDLRVKWVEKGEQIEIEEFDGYESILVLGKPVCIIV